MEYEDGIAELSVQSIGPGLVDLWTVVILTAVVDLLLISQHPTMNSLRAVVGLPLLMFLPGYAVLTLLFPESHTHERDVAVRSGIDWNERLALSFATSLALVPLVIIVLVATAWGITTVSVALALSVVVAVGTFGGAIRRLHLPEHRRLAIPYQPVVDRVTTALREESWTELVTSLILVASLLVAAASLGYAFAVPQEGAAYTDFYLLTETENGEYVSANYPTDLTVGEPLLLVVGIDNQEQRAVTYTVVVQLERVDGQRTVVQEELARFERPLGAGEAQERLHAVTPTTTGEDLRLTYLLFKGEPPAEPTADNAYRVAYIWVDVNEQ